MQREKIKFLKQKLHDEKDQITHLTECLEDPLKGATNTRWRDLEGEDLDEEQLFAKKEILLQRLSDSKENLMEKEVFLEELSSQRKYLENEVEMCKVKSQPAIKRLNEYQSRVRDVTRSMMSLVSELSMYQATALKLEEDKEAKEDEITKARESIAKGHPPSANAVRELKRLIRKNCEEENPDHDIDNIDPRAQENEFGKLYYPAKYAFRTTAEPRPSAYIPDVGIEVPKPYGGMAPFKPSDFPFRST
jgi:chromosome segregation ATPase